MYQNTKVNFKINIPGGSSNRRVAEMLLSDWIDDTTFQYTAVFKNEYLLELNFENREDAMVVKLKGIPPTLAKFIEIL